MGPPIPAEIIKPAREWVQQDMDRNYSCRRNAAVWRQLRLTDYSNKTLDGTKLGTDMDLGEDDVMARPFVFFNYLPLLGQGNERRRTLDVDGKLQPMDKPILRQTPSNAFQPWAERVKTSKERKCQLHIAKK